MTQLKMGKPTEVSLWGTHRDTFPERRMVQLTLVHDYWKNHSFVQNFFVKVLSLLFNTLSRFVRAFLKKAEHQRTDAFELWC